MLILEYRLAEYLQSGHGHAVLYLYPEIELLCRYGRLFDTECLFVFLVYCYHINVIKYSATGLVKSGL